MKNRMKILVVTTDGVFNNKDSISNGINFLPEKIKLIDEVVKKTDAKLAVLNNGKSTIATKDKYLVYNELFRNLGLSRNVAWYFDGDNHLAKFLHNKMKFSDIVIVSSNNKYAKLGRKHFHLTNYNVGLTDADAKTINSLLISEV